MLDGILEEQVDRSGTVSFLGLKLQHDTCEYIFDLDNKFKNYDADAERIPRRDVVYTLASQISDTQGFVSPYIMQYKNCNKKVLDPVAKVTVARFQEWIKDVPRLS